MKRLLVIAAGVALVIWVVSWFRVPEVVATSAARPWPGGLGPLDAAAERFPPRQGNEASVRLLAVAKALPKHQAVDEFVAREIARAELPIGAPPALPDVAALRDLLLRERITWARRREEIGDADTTQRRALLLPAARMLVASALHRARVGDPAAWEDLHAAWNLSRSLDGHPQMMLQTAALSMARMLNAVAWKMPLPAPPWLRELQARDELHPLLQAYHHQTASYWEDGAQMFPTKSLADSVEHDRAIAEELFETTACDVNVPANKLGTDLTSVWRRAFRHRAEREATANALRVREGKPIETTSRCSDGAWSFDGTTLRFSRQIVTAAPDRPMPLVLRLKP